MKKNKSKGKKPIHDDKDFFHMATDTSSSSDVSTSELLSNGLTDEQKAIAWNEFEYEMQMFNRENNF